MATLEEITARIRSAHSGEAALDRTIKLDLKGEGVIHISREGVTNDDGAADLVVTISRQDLTALGKGELDPMRAIMSGRMRLSDMGLAMSLQPQIKALFAKAV